MYKTVLCYLTLIIIVCNCTANLLHISNPAEFETIITQPSKHHVVLFYETMRFAKTFLRRTDVISDRPTYKTFKKLSSAYSEDSNLIQFSTYDANYFQNLYDEYKSYLQSAYSANSSFLLSMKFPCIVLFFRQKQDRECLLSRPRSIITLSDDRQSKFFHGDLTNLESLLHFINENCDFNRKIDGSLNPLGLAKSQLFADLYSLKTNQDQYCQVIDQPTAEEFFVNYVLKSKPVIIRGGIKNWGALSKWTNEYLRETYKSDSVTIKVSPTDDFEGCESIELWEGHEEAIPETVLSQLESPDKVVVRPANLRVSFETFMDLLYSNISASFYLEYCSIPGSLPQMMSDIAPLPWAEFFYTEMSNVWLGNGRSLAKLHFDPFDNLLAQIAGTKQFIVFEPYNNQELYEGHIREGELDYSLETHIFERKRLLESTSMVMSPVDIKNPDLERYPLFKNTRSLNCTVHEGEVLYLPSFWWHEVQSTPDQFKRNIAVNYWYTPFYDKEFPCTECPLTINPVYDHLFQRFNLLK